MVGSVANFEHSKFELSKFELSKFELPKFGGGDRSPNLIFQNWNFQINLNFQNLVGGRQFLKVQILKVQIRPRAPLDPPGQAHGVPHTVKGPPLEKLAFWHRPSLDPPGQVYGGLRSLQGPPTRNIASSNVACSILQRGSPRTGSEAALALN